MSLAPLTSSLLPTGKIHHGFFTRQGGVSTGVYESLNCGPGSSDDPQHVRANRQRVSIALTGADHPICTLYQVHSNRVVAVTEPLESRAFHKADAIVTRVPGVALGVLTADCAPILLADEKTGVIAAAHAGWRGALAGIVEATVEAMIAAGADSANIVGAIGPCIAQESYEVGPELRARFLSRSLDLDSYFVPGEGDRFHFDLAGFAAARLRASGVGTVDTLGADTYADAGRFFSFRRATRRAEGDYGRQISAIFLGSKP
jgi:purine-nucleoside/S-methyl-5'-thioadenosine phosphorylase / adenosine deaminase